MNEIDKVLHELDKELEKMTQEERLEYLRKLGFDVEEIKEERKPTLLEQIKIVEENFNKLNNEAQAAVIVKILDLFCCKNGKILRKSFNEKQNIIKAIYPNVNFESLILLTNSNRYDKIRFLDFIQIQIDEYIEQGLTIDKEENRQKTINKKGK